MGPEALALAAILAGALVLFYTQWLRTDLTALLVLVALMLPWRSTPAGVAPLLRPDQAFSGFGSSAVAMVAAMFVVSAGMTRTGAAEGLGKRLFDRFARSERRLQAAVLTAVTLFSSVVNDTTAVLVWMPLVITGCRERGLAPRRYLLAVAYGSLLGGQWTLIGTRSNIVISDFLAARAGAGLGFFQLTPIALAVFAACLAYYLTAGLRLLPRPRLEEGLAEAYQVTEFLTEVMVTPQSAAVGRTLQDARLRESYGVDVVDVIRGQERIPIAPWMRLEGGDVLVVQGPSSKMARLLKAADFQIREELQVAEGTLRSIDLVMVEAVVAPNSGLIGRTVGAVDFLDAYNLSVLAVSREGRKLGFRPAEVTLRFGDTLLLYGHQESVDRLRRHPDLLLVQSQPFPVLERSRGVLMLAMLAAAVLVIALRLLPAATALPMLAVATILTGCVKMREVYSSIDWAAILVVGGMIPFGLALEETGTAALVAGRVAHAFAGAPDAVLVGALLAIALLLTQLVENVAVAILMSPLYYRIALESGLDPEPLLVGLAIVISSAFTTPVAHESTILVMGPGRYRFRHYLRLGTGFALITWAVALLMTLAIGVRPPGR